MNKKTKKVKKVCPHCSNTGKVWSGGMWVPCETENDCLKYGDKK